MDLFTSFLMMHNISHFIFYCMRSMMVWCRSVLNLEKLIYGCYLLWRIWSSHFSQLENLGLACQNFNLPGNFIIISCSQMVVCCAGKYLIPLEWGRDAMVWICSCPCDGSLYFVSLGQGRSDLAPWYTQVRCTSLCILWSHIPGIYHIPWDHIPLCLFVTPPLDMTWPPFQWSH